MNETPVVCMLLGRHSHFDDRCVFKEACSLRDAGYDVHLVGRLDDAGFFTDMSGCRVLRASEQGGTKWEGITLHGVTKAKGPLWRLQMLRDLARVADRIDADVYHAHEPDMPLAIAVYLKWVKRARGKEVKAVYDMHEYWPGYFSDVAPSYLRGIARYLVAQWERFALRRCDGAFSANQITRALALVANPRIPIEILFNAPSVAIFGAPPRLRLERGSSLKLFHEGSISFNRGFSEMVNMLRQTGEHIQLHVLGKLPPRESEWLTEPELQPIRHRVVSHGWVPYHEVGTRLAEGDVGLIMFRPTRNNMLGGPPNKLFNYMYAGLPIVSVDYPEIRAIITEADCGILIPSEDETALAEAIRFLDENPDECRRMAECGHRYVTRMFWERQAKGLLSVYERMCVSHFAKHGVVQ